MAQETAQLVLPLDEAKTYHNTERHGFFALLVQHEKEMRQSSYPLVEMPTVLNLVDTSRDTWLSQAEFKSPSRRVVNLLRIGLLFADIDTYKMPWAKGCTPEALAYYILDFCHNDGIPMPSLLVYSGRGIQAKWLLDGTIPPQALPRWNACQCALIDKLAELGADPQAKDAARVLRLVNTVNTKSGNVCRVVYVQERDGRPARYNFEYLCEALLPVARWDIEEQRKNRRDKRQLTLIPGGRKEGFRGFSGRRLAWDRLNDLRHLAELRGGVKEGERMLHLFWQLNFLLLSGATNSGQMYYEAATLASEIFKGWNYRSKELMTLYSKAKAYEAGETIEFNGRKYPALYTPRNDTLINLFRITDEEQQQLRTIVSRGEARERDRERDEKRRRKAGTVEREAYKTNLHAKVQAKAEKARKLRASGHSVAEIMQILGVSRAQVFRYIKQSVSKSLIVPPYY